MDPHRATTANDRSNVQWEKDNVSGQVTAFTYDAGGRLLTATQSGGTTNNTYTYTYTYDADGNRLTAVVTGSTSSSLTLTYNAGNQITSTGYSYDGAGNLTASPSVAYTYNGACGGAYPVAIPSVSFVIAYPVIVVAATGLVPRLFVNERAQREVQDVRRE